MKIVWSELEELLTRQWFADWWYERTKTVLNSPDGERAWKEFKKGKVILLVRE